MRLPDSGGAVDVAQPGLWTTRRVWISEMRRASGVRPVSERCDIAQLTNL